MNTNTIDFYQAEIAYRREQMLRGTAAKRRWQRALRMASRGPGASARTTQTH
jgi:hypothetical protein